MSSEVPAPARSAPGDRLALALEAAGLAAWEWDPAADTFTLSPNAGRVLGLAPARLPRTGAEFCELVHPEDRGTLRAALAAGPGAGRFREPIRLRAACGAYRWFLTGAVPLRDEGGNVVRWFGTCTDIQDRKDAEADLRRALGRVSAVLASITEAYFALDEQFRFVEVNPAALRTIFRGVPAVELIGRGFWDVFPEGKGGEFDRQYRRAMAERRPVHFEARSLVADKWFEAHAYPRDGRLEVYVRDVTERKRAEEALRRSEAEFRAIFELAAAGKAQTDPATGRFTRVNRRFCEITGYPEGELLERTFADLTHPYDRRRDAEAVARVLRGEAEDWDFETRLVRRDARTAWAHVTGRLIRDADGRPLTAVATILDVTARKRAELALSESEERLRAALAASQTGTFRWDIATDGLECDDNLCRLLGLDPTPGSADPAPDALGDLLERVHPDDRPGVVEQCGRCAREGADFETDFRVVRPDGTTRWVYGKGQTVRGADGRPLYVTGACTDVTDRKAAEQALLEADRRKDQFLAVLAHELRNPLAPLRNALEILRLTEDSGAPPAPDDPRAQALGMMERQLDQLVRLVDDLLDVSRISRGKIRLRKERVELSAAVAGAVESAGPLVRARGHALRVELPAEPVYLDADPARLAQVLANLLTNAAKYTEPGGRIDLTAERTRPAGGAPGEVVVRVRDTGIGIAPEMLPRLFELFSQAAPALERSEGGLGIGLSLVRSLVQMHGGTVSAASDGPGTGSEFTVRLPAAGAPGPAARPAADPGAGGREDLRESRPAPPGPPPPPPPGGRRVLLVDDNVDAVRSLEVVLRLGGHEVRVAHDGPAALEAAGEFRPEVVLLDIGLPGMSGYEVARELRGRPCGRGVLLVALTGWGQEEDRRRSRDAGFDHHLTKPADPDALEALLTAPPRTGA